MESDHQTPIGLVHVDLAVTQSDARPILYTNRLRSRHRTVRVQRAQRPEIWAFAEIRETANGSDWASAGLLGSLGVENDEDTNGSRVLPLTVLSTEDYGDGSKCNCAVGTVENVRVHFPTRPRPSLAIVQALQSTIRALLQGQPIWRDRQCLVDWLNKTEHVDLLDVKVIHSSGCSSAIGTLSSSARVTLTFQNDSHSGIKSIAGTFEPVEVYKRRVEESLGGVGDHATKIISAILSRLDPNARRHSSTISVGAVLSGLPGIGKTAFSKAICRAVGVQIRYLNAADVFQTFVGHSEAHIVKTFEELVHNAPSILVVDGLESVASSRQGFLDSDSTLEVGVLGTFVSCLEKLKLSGDRVFVLGSTSRLDDIDAAVYSNGRMDLLIRMEPPSQRQRGEILERMMRGWPVDAPANDLILRLSESTGGFVGADLLSLCQKALQNCVNDHATNGQNIKVHNHHFDEALLTTYPSVLQAHHVSLAQSGVNDNKTELFSGIYGVDEALRTINVSLFDPLEDCQRFLKFGTVPPKGILLTGPPGSGKTHLANVVALELRRRGLASFISVRCTDLLTKVVGDTEKSLRELFETARSAAPCVVYFDQIESIAPVRGFDTSTEQTFDRLLSMLLVEMDGFGTSPELFQTSEESDETRHAFLRQQVVILASTNDKNLLDPAILRPGRFDIHIPLTLPDQDARARIFLDALKKVPVDYSSDAELGSSDLLASFVAKHTDGYSASDLHSLLREAAMASMREHFDAPTVAVRYVRQALEVDHSVTK